MSDTSPHKRFWTFGSALLLLTALPASFAQEKSDKTLEAEIGIHRFNEKGLAVYDAFSHVNRIPNGPEGEFPEEPIDTAGRIFGRLGNQEGRILIKLPPGMTKDDYFAFKMFFSFDADFCYEKVANCASCHGLPQFTDAKKHVVTKGGPLKATPSLRNLKKKDAELRKSIMQHLAASAQKKAGEADDVDDMFTLMNITEQDVGALIKFIKLLNDVADTKDTAEARKNFRPLVMDAKLVDVAGLAGESE